MGRAILGFFGKESKGVHQAALLLAVASVINAALALMRDRMLAGAFGASRELDIYYAAFRIPDFLFTLSLLFIASTAVIPVFMERRAKGEAQAREMLNGIFTAYIIVILFVAAVMFFLLPVLIPVIVPGFGGAAQSEAVSVASLLIISQILLGVSNLVASVIQAFRRFVIYALSPMFYNAGIIAGIVFLAPRYGVMGVGWGVVIGAVLHLLIQVPTVVSLGFLPRLGRIVKKDVLHVLSLSFPRTIAMFFNQFNLLAITFLASMVGAGSIAVFNLSFNLQSLPLLIVGLSYSVAAFPTLSELAISNKSEAFYERLASATRHILFWTVPISVLFIVLRAQIVRSVLGTGSFGWIDTKLTTASLLLFSLAITAQSLIHLFVRSFYAMGRTREPVIYNFFGSVVTIGSAAVLVASAGAFPRTAGAFYSLMRVEGLPGASVLAFPLAYAIGMSANALLLGGALWRKEGRAQKRHIMRAFAQHISSGAIIGVTAYVLLRVFAAQFDLDTFAGIFSQGLLAGIGGAAAGLLYLWRIGNRELRELYSGARIRFF